MENTRVFVSGLPPSLTNDQLRTHFASRSQVTDAHVIPNRRIGFVGFKGSAAAQDAVKFFNKTFIRMSKIAVELARPVDADSDPASVRPSKKRKTQAHPDVEPVHQDNPLKRKRDSGNDEGKDPALQEYLSVMRPPAQTKTWADGVDTPSTNDKQLNNITNLHDKAQPNNKKLKPTKRKSPEPPPLLTGQGQHDPIPAADATPEPPSEQEERPHSDADWLRSKTSRLLGLVDDDHELDNPSASVAPAVSGREAEEEEEEEDYRGAQKGAKSDDRHQDTCDSEDPDSRDANISAIRATGRLFLRNLSYNATENDLQPLFSQYGKLDEIHVAFDTRHSTSKGFAYVQFLESDAAVKAYKELDGKDFQGRLLHILPASSKKTYKLNEFEISKLPHKKQQQIKKRAQAATANFSWNSLYMNADAVMSSVAERLGVSKADILDPTSSDAAIKQAHAETHVIQETKAYFSANGVNLDSFKQRERGNTAILVKNFTFGIKSEDLRKLFEPFGQITKLLMPPGGTIAIVEFAMPDECEKAFKGLAYRKLGDSILFLEKAPKDLFEATGAPVVKPLETKAVSQGFSTSDTFNADNANAAMDTSTLFIRNLNFSTTDRALAAVFQPLEGFLSAKVKTKPDPKRPGERLSMGFGFVEFQTRSQAQAAMAAMNGYKLDQHELVIKASHKGADAAERQRREDTVKKTAARRTKIIIKNLPFQATKQDVRSLFGPYGKLRSVRVPQKFDRSSRGFAFADFVSAREAENAMDALGNTHLLGRRLVLQFASEEAIDPEKEIERIEKKVDAQVHKVKLKQLTGSGRKKFHMDAGKEDM